MQASWQTIEKTWISRLPYFVSLFPSGASHQRPALEVPPNLKVYIYISKSFKVISREAYQKKNHLQYAFGGGNPNFTKCWENQKIVHLLQLGETLAFNSLRGLEAELSVRGLMGGNAMPECPDAISGMQGRGYVRLYRVNGIFSNGHQSERMTHQHQKKLNHPNPLFNLKFTGSLTSTWMLGI